jgi:hypothetical protein
MDTAFKNVRAKVKTFRLALQAGNQSPLSENMIKYNVHPQRDVLPEGIRRREPPLPVQKDNTVMDCLASSVRKGAGAIIVQRKISGIQL